MPLERLILCVLLCWPFSCFWNYVIPYLFEFKELDWKQAFCLMFVVQILFKDVNTGN